MSIGPTLEKASQQDISIYSLFGGVLTPYVDLKGVLYHKPYIDSTTNVLTVPSTYPCIATYKKGMLETVDNLLVICANWAHMESRIGTSVP